MFAEENLSSSLPPSGKIMVRRIVKLETEQLSWKNVNVVSAFLKQMTCSFELFKLVELFQLFELPTVQSSSATEFWLASARALKYS